MPPPPSLVESLRCSVRGIVYNEDQQRAYHPTLSDRNPGFTEDWSAVDGCIPDAVPVLDHLAVLTVHQYRPAWSVQLLLRVAQIPHRVLNSRYPTWEATGPLPCVVQLNGDAPRILHGKELLRELAKSYAPQLLGTSSSTSTVLNVSLDELDRCLDESRRRDDPAPSSSLVTSSREIYQAFNERLAQQSYLSGDSLQLVDVRLWDHLVQALTNVHLVSILAEQPHLLQYVERLWKEFFVQTESSDWDVRNDRENLKNPFSGPPVVKHAEEMQLELALMDRLSLRSWQERVVDEARERGKIPPPLDPWETWNRWRYGGSYAAAEKETPKRNRNDELWMGALGLTTLLALSIVNMKRSS